MVGKLILCGTPIGNLEDASFRLVRTLAETDIVACEDVRRTRKLLTHHGIRARELVVYNEGNERRRAPELLARMSRGASVALVSSAGMPALSDPGYVLVRACIDSSIEIEVVPGPSAGVSALVVSGLPPARYVFEGFLPRRQAERRRRIAELAQETRTLVFFLSPHHAHESVTDLRRGLGERDSALARELTKLFEEVRRGPLGELAEELERHPPRGELVLVVAGADANAGVVSDGELAERASELMSAGVGRAEALREVARDAGVPRRRVFDALVQRGSSG